MIEDTVKYFEEKGYSVGIDWPFEGTIVPPAYYRRNPKVLSIMIEINRKLYLKLDTNRKSSNFEVIRELIKDYLDRLDEDWHKLEFRLNLQ